MIEIGRRGFLGGAAALMGMSGCRSLGLGSAKPDLVFGVISDVHITTPESTAMFKRTLRYFRERDVDAVLIAGDLTDWGLKSSLKYMADAWYEIFPGDCAPDGRKVQKLFCTGNHDYDGYWYGDMTLEMHALGYSEDEALVKLGLKECWEELFHEPFANVRRHTVKGYDFIGAEWKGGPAEADRWLAENGKSIDPDRPFFFFTHYPINNTTSCTRRGNGSGYLEMKSLASFPNAVAISGHCHWTLNDERSIWQGGYTALQVPSLSYTTIPSGYENGSDSRKGDPTAAMPKLPSRPQLQRAQGYLVSVFGSRMDIERRDFDVGVEAAPVWIVTPPTAASKPYAFENSSKRTPVPQFPDGAEMALRTVNTEDRNGHWAIMMEIDFPSAKARHGRVYDYEVRAVKVDGGETLMEKYFLSEAFYKLEREEPLRQTVWVNALDLPEFGRYRLEVRPRNCFGAAGDPLISREFESKPGKTKCLKKL